MALLSLVLVMAGCQSAADKRTAALPPKPPASQLPAASRMPPNVRAVALQSVPNGYGSLPAQSGH